MKMPIQIKLVIGMCAVLATMMVGRLMQMYANAKESKTSVAEYVVDGKIVSVTNTFTTNIANYTIGPIRIILTNGVPEKVQITDTSVAAFMVDGASANIVGKTIRVEMKP